MKKEEISYKDLTSKQLDYLKDLYIENRLGQMTEDELKSFVRTILSDQIKDIVGNDEEREAWKEMKEYFKDEFTSKIKKAIQENMAMPNTLTPEQNELEKRIEILEKRKQEKSNEQKDMW